MRGKRYGVTSLLFLALVLTSAALIVLHSDFAKAQEAVTVAVGDTWYCDPADTGGECITDVYVGDTVTWDFSGAVLPHTVTHCGESCDTPTASPLWDSGLINDASTFSYTFAEAGLYAYHCEVHPQQQVGRIDVHEGARPATPTLVIISPPVDYIGTPGVTPTALPDTGQGSTEGGPGSLSFVIAATSGAALCIAGGAIALVGKRNREGEEEA